MNSTDHEWKIVQAGEYVLGTLDSESLVELNEQLESDPDLRDLVIEWQEKLQPLATTVGSIVPPGSVWQRISNELGFNTPPATIVEFDPGRRQRRRKNQRKLRAWQWVGAMALAASTVLAVALWQTQQRPASSGFDVVSIVSAEDNTTLWIINASVQQQTVQVTALAPPAIDNNQDHQLWMVKPNNEGVSSMGLLPRNANVTVINEVAALQSDAIAFAVSLEPLGGSTESVPTGPVVYQSSFHVVRDQSL